MLGVGVGFDVRGAGKVKLTIPKDQVSHLIEDSREGWVKSVRTLLDAYMTDCSNQPAPLFDYSKLRPAGTIISGFGGTSQGPEPLRELHEHLNELLNRAAQSGDGFLSERTIVDIMNLIGRCVVSSNVRRTAEIAFGFLPGEEPHNKSEKTAAPKDKDDDDTLFLELKDYGKHPERAEYGWVSNNSVLASVGKSEYGDAKLVNAVIIIKKGGGGG
jgi:ribonucleoside-triphosphate reductase (thioredoxin)